MLFSLLDAELGFLLSEFESKLTGLKSRCCRSDLRRNGDSAPPPLPPFPKRETSSLLDHLAAKHKATLRKARGALCNR